MFKNELAKYLTDKVKDAGETFSNIVGNSQDFGFTGVDDVTYMKGFTGVDDFNCFTGWDDYNSITGGLNPSTVSGINTAIEKKKQADAKKTGTTVGNFFRWVNTNVITKENVNAAVQYGLSKQNQKLAERDNALAEQSLILQQQQADMTNRGVKAGISGTTILYISIGVIALVGIGFVIYKQKNK
jgi:hypothetical protein